MITINNPTVHRIDTRVDGKKISILPNTAGQEFNIEGEAAEKLKDRLFKRYPAINFDAKQDAAPAKDSSENKQADLLNAEAAKNEQSNKGSNKK